MDFKTNLHFMYWLMVASEDLLLHAVIWTPYGPVKNYYVQHRREEKDHALWLKDDLLALGIEPVLDYRAAAIAGSQYYLMRHKNPVAFLGYIAALESSPMPIAEVERLEAAYGTEGLRTVRYHAEHDPQHYKDLSCLIGQLGARDQADVFDNLRQVSTWLQGVMQ